jgi:hypothetical protein
VFSLIPHPDVHTITPLVSGVPLPDLISEFEKAENYEPAGGYRGIVPAWFDYGPLEKYFLGECQPDSYWAKQGGQYVLGCECGEVGCWPLLCRIRVQDDNVIWDQFKQPYRDTRDYSHFGPLVFDGAQYRNALASLKAEWSRIARTPRDPLRRRATMHSGATATPSFGTTPIARRA